MTPPVKKWLEESNRIMQGAGFSYAQVRAAVVWAARWRECPQCGVGPYQRCENLSARKQTKKPVYTNWPHEDRVDRLKLVEALKQKGYAPK